MSGVVFAPVPMNDAVFFLPNLRKTRAVAGRCQVAKAARCGPACRARRRAGARSGADPSVNLPALQRDLLRTSRLGSLCRIDESLWRDVGGKAKSRDRPEFPRLVVGRC
jgi:hypothetical protein